MHAKLEGPVNAGDIRSYSSQIRSEWFHYASSALTMQHGVRYWADIIEPSSPVEISYIKAWWFYLCIVAASS